MDILSELQTRYTEMCQKFDGGLSNTSTKKFDPIIQLFSKNFNIPAEDIYAVGSGSRPGNIEVRLSQGTRATQHTKLGLTFIVDEMGTPENTKKLTNSAFVTIEKFLGRGKSSYENVLVIVDTNGTISVSGLVHSHKSIISKRLIDELSIPMVKEVEVKHNSELQTPADILLPYDVLVPKVKDSFKKFWSIIDQHGAGKDDYIDKFEKAINPYLAKLDLGYTNVFQILDIQQYDMIVEMLVKEFPELSYLAKGRDNNGAKYQATSTQEHYRNFLRILALSDFHANLNTQKSKRISVAVQASPTDSSYLRAMRTKPFLLLAGISGTGKSRIVKQFAFKSCPDIAGLRKDPISPGNYCLVEVKPNWHDSTELLGYESQIGEPHYVLTTFVKFVAKAMLNPDVPFFLCLDEMNLAPVEQYFAEFLSVLESRKLRNGHITSEPLVKADVFRKYENSLCTELFDLAVDKAQNYDGTLTTSDIASRYGKESAVYDILKAEGMRIPENLIVIGTVNMDETTHQFSRKVIDRAMTIEMNIEDGKEPFDSFFEDYEELDYVETPLPKDLFLPEFVNAAEALNKIASEQPDIVEKLKQSVPEKLAALNSALNGTPFKIAYRVQNELILYFYSLLVENPEAEFDNLLNTAIDNIMMMKVLPRVEGDEDTLKEPLKKLAEFTANIYPQSADKVKEMANRLERAHFTSFWP